MRVSPALFFRVPCQCALAFALLLAPVSGFSQASVTFTGTNNPSSWVAASFNAGAGPTPGPSDTLVMNGGTTSSLGPTTSETVTNLTNAGGTASQSILGEAPGASSVITFTVTGTVTETGGNSLTFRGGSGKLISLNFNDVELSGAGNLLIGTATSQSFAAFSATTVNIASSSLKGLIFSGTNGSSMSIGSLSITSGIVAIQDNSTWSSTLTVNSLSGAAAGSIRGTNGAANTNVASTLIISSTNSSAVTFSGSMVDGSSNATSLAVVKQGAGTQILAGASTYSGGTTVTAGTLLLTNTAGSATGSGSVTVSGGKLGGTGFVVLNAGSLMEIKSGGTLAGGLSTAASGALSISGTGNVTLDSGSTIELTLGASGAHSTLTRVGTASAWSIASDERFTFDLLSGATVGLYDNIITGLAADPGVTGWTINNAGVTGSFSYSGGNVDLTITSIAAPEPSTVALLLGAVAAFGILRRRRNQA